jgi:hypothetical protein
VKRKRRLTLAEAARVVSQIQGARQRDLTARHLLLHPELVKTAPAADRAALGEYIDRKGWRSLYGHDRGMYRLLRAGVEKIIREV